jgi:prepilin-type N-terminal cleavage/methylation domain-containing protein/prepilin-type processing-associated H-X9-DG protein
MGLFAVKLSRGMTLFELLMVLAILLVLSTVVTVVTFRAKESGRKTTCISNLASIGKGLLLYASDNSDELPPYPFMGANPKQVEFIDSLNIYGVVPTTWYCPSDDRTSGRLRYEFLPKHDYTSYVMHMAWFAFGRSDDKSSWALSLAESKVSELAESQPLFHEDSHFVEKNGKKWRTSFHGDQVNMLFIDGSVRFENVGQPN